METRKFTAACAIVGTMLILLASGAFAQPSVHDVAGTATLNGSPAPIGAQIAARDSNGTEVGNFTTTVSGFYGIMHLNGDDPNSTGDVISFFIGGVEADQTLIWQPFGYDPNFALTACDISTYSITVQTDSDVYFRGQGMAISGYLMNSQCALEPDASIAYNVPDTAIMGQLQTNGTGYFSTTVTIPSDMPFGEYTLWASYPPGSNETVYSTVNFTVAEEPLQPVVITGGGGGGGGCSPSWTCTEWSECQPNGTQSRACSDLNSCGTPFGKPNETQSCTYAQAAAGCTEGSRICSGSDLMECSGGSFATIQTCEFGCSGNACNEKPAEAGPGSGTNPPGGVPVAGLFLLEPSAWPYWILIAFVVILLAWFLLGRRKKKKK